MSTLKRMGLILLVFTQISLSFSTTLSLNQELKSTLNIEVYGDAHMVPDNDFKPVLNGFYNLNGSQGEYRYHGYDRNHNLYTNIHFPNDAYSKRALSDKLWIHKGWKQFTKYNSSLNDLAIRGKTEEEKFIQSWIRQSLPFQLNNGTNLKKLGKIEEYLYIQTPPTSTHHGEGRMWHKTKSNYVFYQTFSLPPIEKKSPDILCHVDILEKDQISPQPGQNIIPLDIKVTGEFLDKNTLTHYSKEDLIGFNLSLGDSHVYIPLKSANKSYHTFKIDIPKAILKDTEKRFTGKAQAVYSDQNKSIYVSDYDTITLKDNTSSLISNFNIKSIPIENLKKGFAYEDISKGKYDSLEITLVNEDDVVSKTFKNSEEKDIEINRWLIEEIESSGDYKLEQSIYSNGLSNTKVKHFTVIEAEMQAIDIDLDIPEYIFDHEKLIIVDHTDKTFVKEITAMLNNQPIDIEQPSSFKPSSRNQLHHLKFEYLSTTGHISVYETWIEVLTTKPKVQGSLSGTFKENRDITFENTSNNINDPRLLKRYPIKYQFKLDGKPWSMKEILTLNGGEHTLEIIGSNSLGNSSTQTIEFFIRRDIKPDILFNIWNPIIGRKEELSCRVDINSVDGDLIEFIHFSIIYPDGTEEEVKDFDNLSFNHLGEYTLVVKATEDKGQSHFVKRKVFIENKRPLTKSIFNGEGIDQKHHLLMIIDDSIDAQSHEDLMSLQHELEDSIRLKGINVQVNILSMKDYSREVYTEAGIYTGDKKPGQTINYKSGPYQGILSLKSAHDLGDYKDLGHMVKKKTCETVINENGWDCSGRTSMDCFTRNCNRQSMTYSQHLRCCGCKKKVSLDRICNVKKYWRPNIQWISNWHGTYTGNTQMTFRQMLPEISLLKTLTSIYITDAYDVHKDITTTLGDPDYIVSISDLQSILEKLTREWSENQSKKILINEPFSLQYIDTDPDGDQTIEHLFNTSYESIYDNPLGADNLTKNSTIIHNPGKYTIEREIIDEIKNPRVSNRDILEIYAHRKPIAKLSMDWDYDYDKNQYLMSWNDQSYDPDYQYTKLDKGIKVKRFKLRKVSESFIYTQPKFLASGEYEIYYSVEDYDGATSDVKSYKLILPEAPPPMIQATFNPNHPLAIGDTIAVENIMTRYSKPLKVSLVSEGERLPLEPSVVNIPFTHWGNTFYTIPKIPDGAYTISLEAIDPSDPKSNDILTHTYEVLTPIDLKTAETLNYVEGDEIVLSAETSQYVDSVTATINVNNQSEKMNLKRVNNRWIGPAIALPKGHYTVLFEAVIDTSPIKSERKEQELIINPLQLSDIKIKGDWQVWDGKKDKIGIYRDNMPHRFLALETVSITGVSNANDYSIIIDACENFKEKVKDSFNYEETFKTDYPFPKTYSSTGSEFNLTFPLPLAKSTLTLDNKRIKMPYQLYITISNGDFKKTYTVDDLDITSNIYDFTYIQSQ